MAFIQGIDRNQQMMLPECIEDYIDEDNSVRVIDAYVNTLDVKAIGFTKAEKQKRGAPSYHPQTLLKLYLYGYMNSLRTSRKLERETYRNIEAIWLLEKLQPDFKTIADFRKENKKQLEEIFKDFTLLCKQLELFGEKFIAVDGTKIKASNSKKNNYTKKKITRQLKYIEEKAKEYLEQLDENDEKEKTEQKKYTKKEIEEKIEQLKRRKEKYKYLEKKLTDSGENEISTVDQDARLMDNKNNGVEVSYNVQTAVDSENSLIVAYDVINNPSDQGNLNKMAEKAKEIFIGKKEIEVAADKGYYQGEDLKKCEENKTITYVAKQTQSNSTGDREFYGDKFKYVEERDIYICPTGKELYRAKHKKEAPKRIRYKNYKACQECEYKKRCTKSAKGREINRSKHQDFLDIVDARTQENMEKYLERQKIVEHPYGTIKRSMNAGYFLTRGLDSVKAETALIMLAYNMRRAINILGVKQIIHKIQEIRGNTFQNSNIIAT